ncbi:MAG: ArnT family glycosyltransferase [Bryobacteraceae bacterium]
MPRGTLTILLLLALLFLCSSVAFLPLLGFEYDEVIFIQPLFHPAQSFASIKLFHHAIPVMQTSYAGALKTWIYAPIFRFYAPSPFSVRFPVVILASITIFLLGVITRHLASSRAAIFACAVLISDLNFFMVSVFDWGPVVIQNLLLAIGLYLILVQRKKPLAIPLAAFIFGLAMWDKALFLWTFSGLVLSGVIVGFRVIKREMSLKKSVFALAAFGIGASPLLLYNLKHHGETLQENTKLSFSEVGPKLTWLRIAVNDQALENFFVDRTLVKSAATNPDSLNALSALTSRFHNAYSGRFPAFLFLCLAGLALARSSKRRLILWLELAIVLAWLQAAMTKNAGTSVHHLALFYPILFIVMGICADEITTRLQEFGRAFLGLFALLLCLTGFGIIGAQYVDFHRYSPSIAWTDADKMLARYLTANKGHQILAADWGIASQADVLTLGTLPIYDISFGLQDHSLTQKQLQNWARIKPFIVLHTAEHTVFPNQNSKLESMVKAVGLTLIPVATIQDQAGHIIFEVDELTTSS